MTTPVFICCLSVRQWNCFRSPVSTSKERSSSTTELRSSTRTSPPQRRAWWEITWTYPTWIWRVPGSSWRGLWWVSRYKLTLTSRKAESDLWNSAASPSPSSTVASVCEYMDWFTVAVISEHTRQNLFWMRNLSSWLYKKNSTVFHVGGGIFLIVAQTWCQPHKHPIQNKLSQQLLISLYCGHFLLPLISSQWRRRRRYFWDFLSRNIQSVMKYNKVYNCFKVISLKGHVWKCGYLFMTQYAT